MFLLSKCILAFLTKKKKKKVTFSTNQAFSEKLLFLQGHHMALTCYWSILWVPELCHIPSIYVCFLFPPPLFLLTESAGKRAYFKKLFCFSHSSFLNCCWILQLLPLMRTSHEGYKRTSQRHRLTGTKDYVWKEHCTSREARLQMSRVFFRKEIFTVGWSSNGQIIYSCMLF